jgi:two-component system nitrogen regulation response regulator NtrX
VRVLVVDDEKNIRDSLEWLIKSEGHEVKLCTTGEEAVAIVSSDIYDLMLLDVWLPGQDGLSILEEVVRLRPELKVIMISGHADLSTAVRATRLGAYDFFEKPLNVERVVMEIRKLHDHGRMEKQVSELKELVEWEYRMVGHSKAMRELRDMIDRVAPSDGRVMIYGENGTGKELVAREIHEKSARRDQPFVKLNCAAIPKELIESELFGYERGAFTGATGRKIGVFEEAEGGSLLLDEVGDMALETQAKLLRVLQENEFVRVGGTTPHKFDVRVISATNKDLVKEISTGQFREDLYFRLNVIPIYVPRLRERREDIPVLVNHFLQGYCKKNGKKTKTLKPEAVSPLMKYHWQGNIRELRNLMERLAIMTEGDEIGIEDVAAVLPGVDVSTTPSSEPLLNQSDQKGLSFRERVEAFEKQLLLKEFENVNGNVSRLAANLKTDRANLHRKLRRYGIKS